MSSIKNAFRYCVQYGLHGLIGLSWEKAIVDPHRFRTNVKREIPVFPEWERAETADIDEEVPSNSSLSILYLSHYFYPTKYGGKERFLLNLAKHQKSAGNRILVLTLGNLSLDHYPLHYREIYYRKYQFHGIEVMEIRHKKPPLGLYHKAMNTQDYAMEEFAEWLLEEYKIGVVHATYPQPFVSLLKVCEKSDIPYVVTMTDFNMLCHYSSMVDKAGYFCSGSDCGNRCATVCKTYGVENYTKRYEIAENVLYQASAVTVLAEFVAKVVANEFPKNQVYVVPHGIGKDFTGNGIRSGFGATKFVYAGEVCELKGVHLLIEAFRKLGNNVRLDIYGDDKSSYAAKLKRDAGTNIKFHGAVASSQMAHIYRAADCVVVPSMWYETYNFVVREALACGCLAIASRIGAMPEAITEEKNGYLVEPGDVTSLVDALQKATKFDWSTYCHASFPSIEQEGETYSKLYARCFSSPWFDTPGK